jgi:hypothetical protein
VPNWFDSRWNTSATQDISEMTRHANVSKQDDTFPASPDPTHQFAKSFKAVPNVEAVLD